MNESIGRCVWCGMVDHHLIDETCPQCRERVITISSTLRYTGNPSVDHMQLTVAMHEYGNVPLGIEAADPSRVQA